jgi:hypothetical protein
MKQISGHSFLILMFLCTCIGCVRPAPGTYITDPSKRESKIEPRPLHLEVFVLEHNSTPVTKMEVKAETRETSVKGMTNFRGRTRFNLKRTESEPVKFIFKKDGYTSIEIVHHIPSGVSNAGVVFSFDEPGKVKFVKYTVKGLYR